MWGLKNPAHEDLPIRPFLKWAGGKRQLLPEIRKLLPPNIGDLTYYEPFVGAGALLFDLRPGRAVINDSNADLMMTYRVLRERPEELTEKLREHEKKHDKGYYYKVRAWDRDKTAYDRLDETERAARLIYLNRTCYNGLYRVNSRGFFNVPYGRYKKPAICEEEVLRGVHRYLRDHGVTIINGDFGEAVKTADRNSFVYFDPPYHGQGKGSFTAYQAGTFGEAEQIRLRDTFLALTGQGIPCLLSNADTPFIRELYQNRGLGIFTVPAKRAINSNAAARGTVPEVLIKN
ncbi:MAG: DNA adenine methylase [Treponema sp.]|jgi:DNA adenine methylase|nr:DNA adenine methylase [Treponema sp.]